MAGITLERGPLTFTAFVVAGGRVSVVASGTQEDLAALLEGFARWPTDAEISQLVGVTVRFEASGESALEAIYSVSSEVETAGGES